MKMIDESLETVKETVAELLEYYGIRTEADYESFSTREPVDFAGFINSSGEPDLAVVVDFNGHMLKDIKKLARVDHLKNIIVIAQPKNVPKTKRQMPPVRNMLEQDVDVFPVPSAEETAFENRIRQLTGRTGNQRFFDSVAIRKAKTGEKQVSQVIADFESMIRDQGLDATKAKELIYKAAVGGLSTYSGKMAYGQSDEPVFERSRDLPKEGIFLMALGVLTEEKKEDRGFGYDSSGYYYLTLSENEKATGIATEVVNEKIENRKHEIRKLMKYYPKAFNFIILTGSLGIFAPRPAINLERQRPLNTGVIRTTFQYENTTLLETIRLAINNLDLQISEWNRINCMASFPEIRNLVSEYFEKFEKIGIAVRGFRGIKRLYLPLNTLAMHVDLASLRDSYRKDKLKKFALWDALLRTTMKDRDLYERLNEMEIEIEEIREALDETEKAGLTSFLLPRDAVKPFAVYNEQRFRNYCLDKMRTEVEDILDVTW